MWRMGKTRGKTECKARSAIEMPQYLYQTGKKNIKKRGMKNKKKNKKTAHAALRATSPWQP